jgi:exodeoxyribonuclease V alpha subunit
MLLLPTKEARNDLRERLRVQRRDMAAVLSLRAAESDGHSCLPAEKICSSATSLLRKNCKIMGRDACDIAHLTDMTARGLLVPEEVEGTECYYQSELYDVEREVARRLRAMALAPPPWKQSLEEQDPAWINELGDAAALSAQQREMATKLLQSKLAILTGGPGTGKTTLLRCVVNTLEANSQRILLCSPTGRASRRLSEATGRPTSTVHMATAMNLPASADVVIVDEASVLDVRVLVRLLQQMAPTAALYFVGDADQLPPVGPSHVLQALLDTNLVPVHRLSQVHRQVSPVPSRYIL